MSDKATIDNPPKDRFGRELAVGCYLIHCVAYADSQYTSVCKVLKVEFVPDDRRNYKDAKWNIVTIGVDDRSWYAEQAGGIKRNETKGRLQFPDRTVIVPREMIPQRYLDLLEPVTMDTNLKAKA